MRAVVAAPGISKEQQDWHIGLFKQVYDSPDWQDFLQKNALEAVFNQPSDIAVGLDGEIYIADTKNHCVRVVRDGLVERFAGTCDPTLFDHAGDGGPALDARFTDIYGVEVDASATLFDSLRIDLGYTYLHTRIKELTIPTLPADSPFSAVVATTAVGQELIFSPHNKVTVSATYTLPLDKSLGEVSLGATFTHTDKYFYDASGDTTIPEILTIAHREDI